MAKQATEVAHGAHPATRRAYDPLQSRFVASIEHVVCKQEEEANWGTQIWSVVQPQFLFANFSECFASNLSFTL